ncbi:MAG TPA: hypothetical protein VGI39_11185 [Polyangiaceae bacterium]
MSNSPQVKTSSSVRPPRLSPVPMAPRAMCVYGDSTPFPYPGTFIETVRHAVDCGVALVTAQHVLQRSTQRVSDIDRAKQLERARLEAMNQSLRRTLAIEMAPSAERLVRAGTRILEASRVAIESEIVMLESLASAEIARSRKTCDEARMLSRRAVEKFLLQHELPGSEVALRLSAQEERYSAEAQVATPFGVDATFELQVPEAHEWGRPRRVGDLNPGTEVHLPQESGLFFKKTAVQPVKLDRLFVASLRIGGTRGVLTLRKQPTSGAGFKFDFDASGERTRVLIARLGEDGSEILDPAEPLAGDDAVHVLRLWQRVLDSTGELHERRQAMTRAVFDGHPIAELDEPQLIAERLVKLLAPIVREIAARSGASGELVLRRDVRAGRRDEIYITKAELHEKVLTLPPGLRGVFDSFELDSPRSPRAPAPSMAPYEELEGEELEDVSQAALLVAGEA